MDFALILAVFLALSLLSTWLIKRYTKQQTWHIISLIRTSKHLGIFDYFAKKIGRPLDWFSDLGLVLGFGAFALDYLHGRKMGTRKRVLFFIFSASALTLLFFAIDASLGGFMSNSPLMGEQFPLLAIVFGISGFSGFTVLLLAMQAIDILAKIALGRQPCPGVAPLIPGVELPNVPIVIPVHAWISLLIILLVHEGMHGIAARRQKLKIKSAGVLLLGFLPLGAFVEPDEKQVMRKDGASRLSALRLFSAGPTANLASMPAIKLFALGISLLLAFFVAPWYAPLHSEAVLGVGIASVDANISFCGDVYESSAYGALNAGMVIKKANDVNISGPEQLQLEVSQHPFKPLKLLVQDLNTGVLSEKTLLPNKLGRFGFTIEEIGNPSFEAPLSYSLITPAISFLESFLGWLFWLGFFMALVNFLPMVPFDGGRIASIIFMPYFSRVKLPEKRKEELVARFFLALVLSLFVLNALPLFL
ncbi:MAG: site-2 protease family protein [Candidatus Diapherotrites archaeon]